LQVSTVADVYHLGIRSWDHTSDVEDILLVGKCAFIMMRISNFVVVKVSLNLEVWL